MYVPKSGDAEEAMYVLERRGRKKWRKHVLTY